VKYTDIAIVGGGLAVPPDFRVEKLSGEEQIARLPAWVKAVLARPLGALCRLVGTGPVAPAGSGPWV
jgi:hypothetical protein